MAPCELRHAAVFLCRNSWAPATEVARRAGHGCADLPAICAGYITAALGVRGAKPDPGDEDDDDTARAS
jgi:hypothetical protein